MDCLFWDEHTGKCLNGKHSNYGEECDNLESLSCFTPQKDGVSEPCFWSGKYNECSLVGSGRYGMPCTGSGCWCYRSPEKTSDQTAKADVGYPSQKKPIEEPCFSLTADGKCENPNSNYFMSDCGSCSFYMTKRLSDQSAKADAGKPRLTLVPRKIIWAIAKVREFGTKKYKDPDNWKRVTAERYRDALFRHLLAYLDDPNGKDPESGLPILWHVATNVAFLVDLEWNDEKH